MFEMIPPPISPTLDPLFAAGGIMYAIEHSNLAGKAVLVVLLIGSLFSWSVMITKFSMVQRVRKARRVFLKSVRASRRPLNLYLSGERFAGSPLWSVYISGSREALYHLAGRDDYTEAEAIDLSRQQKLSATAIGAVRSAVEREVGEQALGLESRMILLATAVSGAPFLGLLGTVWGVMDAFSAIAATGAADLTSMAPGISGSLVTTVVGLLVAIPAMFGYNYLVTSIRSLTVELDNFAAELTSSIEHTYLET